MSNLDNEIKTQLEKLVITKKQKPIKNIEQSAIDKDIKKKTDNENSKTKPSKSKPNPQDKDTKQKLGQFYTTNQDYILQDMYIPDDVKIIIEPFAGNGDLLKFIKEDIKDDAKNKYTLEYIKKNDL